MFALDKEQNEKLDKWLKTEVFPFYVARQREAGMEMHIMQLEDGTEIPYGGAIGGGLTYEFSPTGLGLVVKVTYRDFTIDLTDYDMW
jgi:hypothetical protein